MPGRRKGWCAGPAEPGRELAATGLFIAIGHGQRTELLTTHLELDAEGYLKVDAPSTRTNLPGPDGPDGRLFDVSATIPPHRPDSQVCAPRSSAAGGQARGARIPVVYARATSAARFVVPQRWDKVLKW